jgi:hypothetical protein
MKQRQEVEVTAPQTNPEVMSENVGTKFSL